MKGAIKRKLSDVCTIIAGQSPESKYYNQDGIGLPFFQGKADFGDLYPTIRTYCSTPTKIAQKNDILLSVRAPVGATNLAPTKVCIGRGLTAIRPADCLSTKYLLLFFRYFQAELAQKGAGTTFNAITQTVVKNIEIPVPHLEEQERIISKIEELFSEIDNAVSSLKAAKRKLAAYRHAVLKSVFNNTSPKRKISELSTLVTSGSRGWAKYYSPDGVRFIRITDLTRDKIILDNSNIQRVKLPKITEGKRSKLQGNDILISITADLGSIALVPCDIEEAYINQHIALVRFSEPKLGKLAAWYLKSEYGQKDLLKNKRGGGKLGLGLDDIRNTPIPDIPIHKAESIVGILEERFSVCDEIEKVIGKSIQESTALKQSILKKAFEGELV